MRSYISYQYLFYRLLHGRDNSVTKEGGLFWSGVSGLQEKLKDFPSEGTKNIFSTESFKAALSYFN